ncbi:MAG: hypothetical protein GY811_27690 [Myxococcales bacterium]|nr:hypothetical protein [Myxococcales bacterium]
MKTPWLNAPLLALVSASLIACESPNPEFCETNEQCGTAASCDVSANECRTEAGPDAGEETEVVPADPGESCDAGRQCIKTAPNGWIGPVAKAEAAAGNDLAGCAGDFDEEVGLFGSEIALSGSCDCECDSPTSLTCGNGFVTEWTSPSEGACEQNVCDVLGGSCTETYQTLFPGVCTRILSNMKDGNFLRARLGKILRGTCETPEVAGNLSSNFENQTILCEAKLVSAGCEEDELCAPAGPEGFGEGLCIVREGEHDCPADFGYTEKTLLFTGLDDNRACDVGSCECEAPTGTCGGKIELHKGGADEETCFAPLATLEQSSSAFGDDNMCQALPALATTVRYVPDTNAHSCQPAGSAEVAGSAVGTGATTICCMP